MGASGPRRRAQWKCNRGAAFQPTHLDQPLSRLLVVGWLQHSCQLIIAALHHTLWCGRLRCRAAGRRRQLHRRLLVLLMLLLWHWLLVDWRRCTICPAWAIVAVLNRLGGRRGVVRLLGGGPAGGEARAGCGERRQSGGGGSGVGTC